MKIRAIAALLFILISVSAFGEGRIKITGYVRDADGNPLELVNVRVKEMTREMVTRSWKSMSG
mgnify:CR=1 FL=1